MSDGVRIDLHVHSTFSPDSRQRIDQIVDRLGVAGLQGFALTDHNTIAGHSSLAEFARRFPRLRIVPGVEVSTVEGHLLVYGVSELPPIRRPIAETLDWVHSRGAVAVLPHPFRWAHGVGRRICEEARVHGVEALNGHNGAVANARAELVGARRGLALTGGSDAHDLRGLGRTYTTVPDEAASVEEILQAIRSGHTGAGGTSLRFGERVRLLVRTAALRALRGFRPV
jgi:predicted metal-dependent phosphoesterase TrpH